MIRQTIVRPGVVVASAMAAIALLGSGAAWACVPQPLVSVRPRASGPRADGSLRLSPAG